jgi:hypothetical protein
VARDAAAGAKDAVGMGVGADEEMADGDEDGEGEESEEEGMEEEMEEGMDDGMEEGRKEGRKEVEGRLDEAEPSSWRATRAAAARLSRTENLPGTTNAACWCPPRRRMPCWPGRGVKADMGGGT